MLLDTHIIIKPSTFSPYYKSLGYIFHKKTDDIQISIKDLKLTSTILVKAKCNICENIVSIKYKNYIKNTKNNTAYFSCSKKCSNDKRKETNKIKYSTEYVSQSDTIKEKVKKTNLERYGTEYVSQSDTIKEKVKKTNLERYGVETALQSEIIKEKIKKTNLERYGYEYVSQSNIIKEKVKKTYNENYEKNKNLKIEKSLILNKKKYGNDYSEQTHDKTIKTKKTNLKKYGVEHATQSLIIKNKTKETNLKKYGVEYFSQSNLFKTKTKNKTSKNTLNKYLKIINHEYEIISYGNYFSILHKKCNEIFHISRWQLYDRNDLNVCLCTKCHPISEQKSIKEKELNIFLKENNVEFLESDKTILSPKHIDIYIPSYNLAIEFNGLYWHSENFKDKNYHLEKSLKCQEKGVQLLHIWEDEWVYKKDIIKSIILNKLGLIKEKVYARQCGIRVVEDSKLIREFLDTNHIQGYSQSSIKLGLFYQNELVSLMTFGYRHTNAKKEFELIRFCNKINLNVIGAASKLFKYFCDNYQFTELISYSDFRLFDGKMYQTLGFTKQYLSKPDYFWCKNLERKHRFNFNKQKLIKEGYDQNKTEVEIMHDRGYYRIFGCGQYRWIYKKREV